jgi:5-formyltetrahydrofolate cyclo-ligase
MSSSFSEHQTLSNQKQLRQQMRAQRRALSPKQQLLHSQAMCQRLTRSSVFRNSRNIAIYMQNDGEMGAATLLTTIRTHKKHCYLPVLRPMLPNRLWFCEFRQGDQLVPNRYNIPEPDMLRRKPILPHGLDLVLVPLVAFDSTCNRIGMGGGFYDRTFAYLKTRSRWRKPKLIGIAHELQRVDSISANPWDISLDGVITELTFYKRQTT